MVHQADMPFPRTGRVAPPTHDVARFGLSGACAVVVPAFVPHLVVNVARTEGVIERHGMDMAIHRLQIAPTDECGAPRIPFDAPARIEVFFHPGATVVA